MPIADISRVTETIINLIELEVGPLESESPEIFEVTAVPPDDNTDNPRRVSVHLLHLLETPEFRNIGDGGARSKTPVQQLPMGLALQYAISVAPVDPSDPDAPTHALAAQRILGRIARVFHDFPRITSTTKAGPSETDVLHSDLNEAGDALELILRPAPLQETFGYWATQNQRLPRACLFLEVRVVMLQPKPPEILPGIVLSVGNFVYPNKGPQLLGSRSTIRFQHPVSGAVTSLAARPARVAMFPLVDWEAFDSAMGDMKDNALLLLEASALSPGKRFLVLATDLIEVKIAIDDPAPENDGWQLKVVGNTISLRFRRSVTAVSVDPPQPLTQPIDLLPGVYSARVVVEDDRIGGLPRPRSSNEISFGVGPQITAITLPDPLLSLADTYEVTIPGGYLTAYATDPPPAPPGPQPVPRIALMVAGKALTRVGDEDTPGPGEFRRGTAGGTPTDLETTITFVLPDGTAVPGPGDSPLPVQLVIAEVPAPPAWITGEEVS